MTVDKIFKIPPPLPYQIPVNYNLNETKFNPSPNKSNSARESLYSLIMDLFNKYPKFILFCEYIKKLNNKNTFIGFLSRDTYFVYLLYKTMYASLEEGNDYAYIYSSRICFLSENNEYFKYINYYREKRNQLLLVDMHGSGQTFTHFIHKFKIKDIKLLFFTRRTGYKKPPDLNFISTYMPTSKLLRGLVDIERLLRAPHHKVQQVKYDQVTNSFKLNYLIDDKDKFDKLCNLNTQLLMKSYSRILNYMPYTKYIRYLTYSSFLEGININFENIKYNGILFLDIDNTITNLSDYTYIREIINYCSSHNIKIVLVSARAMPFSCGLKFNQKINSISTILDNIRFDYRQDYITVWYNTKSYLKSNIPIEKGRQIKKTIKDYQISIKNCIFIDDKDLNVNMVKKMINIKAYLSNNGITKNIYKIVMKDLNQFIKNV